MCYFSKNSSAEKSHLLSKPGSPWTAQEEAAPRSLKLLTNCKPGLDTESFATYCNLEHELVLSWAFWPNSNQFHIWINDSNDFYVIETLLDGLISKAVSAKTPARKSHLLRRPDFWTLVFSGSCSCLKKRKTNLVFCFEWCWKVMEKLNLVTDCEKWLR